MHKKYLEETSHNFSFQFWEQMKDIYNTKAIAVTWSVNSVISKIYTNVVSWDLISGSLANTGDRRNEASAKEVKA